METETKNTEHMSADVEITAVSKPKSEGEKVIIYYRGTKRDSNAPVYGLLYFNPSEMEKFITLK